MQDKKENYSQLERLALDLGACLFGVTDIEPLKKDFIGISPQSLKDLKYGVSLAFRLSDKIIEDIQDHPTQLYLHHYRQVNYLLDRMALKMSNFIQNQGWQALPMPASQTIDWKNQKGHLSHKKIAVEAGLGWRGRNNLLVSPQFGSRIRLVTVLTNLPLYIDKRIEEDCGACFCCLEACPAKAIKEKREEFDWLACFEKLGWFRKKHNIAHYICGICIKACPGKKLQ
ncbi:epoxyqueuosine reductase [Patescibacteria group bacterium]|nr:epoxyqueuosine reductase [Patescibacteria group bacterium]